MGQPAVVAGALAMAAYGYRRETDDVDIALPIVISAPYGDSIENAARALGLTIRARHAFGGLDLRAGDARIGVITLDRDMPALVPEAVQEAVASVRTMSLFSQRVFVVSLGHLIAMKLVAERKKDIGDITELIKARLESGLWAVDYAQVRSVVREHLGWYAVRALDSFVQVARMELGL